MAEEDLVIQPDQTPELRTDIPQAPDTTVVNGDIVPNLRTDIPQAPDTVVTDSDTKPTLNIDIPTAPDTIVTDTAITPKLDTEFPTAPDTVVTVPDSVPQLSQEFPVADDIPLERAEFSFARGRWLPKGDALTIGEENFSELENFRYTDFGLEGVGGFTRLNGNYKIATSIENGIQLTTNYSAAPSYVIVQSGESPKNYYYYTDAIPNAVSGAATALHSGVAGNSTARFSKLPNGHIGICDGKENLIWAGEQMPVGAFLVADIVDGTIAYFPQMVDDDHIQDFTNIINNTLNDSNNYVDLNYVTTAFGDDSSTVTVANTSGNIMRYTDNEVVDHHCDFVTNGLAVGHAIVVKKGGPFGGTNEGMFKVTAVAETYFEVENPDGALEGPVTLTADAIRTWGKRILIGTTRRARGFTFDIETANTKSATLTEIYVIAPTTGAFTGITTGASVITDGTEVGGKTMAQSGSVTWTDPEIDEVKTFFKGYYLYWYLLGISDCNANIANVTAKCDVQSLSDIWDGVYRKPILCKYYDDDNTPSVRDYTLEINTKTPITQQTNTDIDPYTVPIQNMEPKIDYLTVMFEEPIRASIINLYTYKTGNSATQDGTVNVRYNVGDTWCNVRRIIRDSTAVPGYNQGGYAIGDFRNHTQFLPFYRSGVIQWRIDPTQVAPERSVTIDGITGYAYKFVTETTKITGDVQIDTIDGIPDLPEIDTLYIFPFQYKNRAMWCGAISDNEKNRVDYSKTNTVDVYNGMDASGFHHERSLYFGDHRALTGAIELFNQYGDTVESIALFFKDTETYMLTGYNPETFKIHRISNSIGCPAPLTITSAEVSLKVEDAPAQNIALWLSDKGPKMYINNTIRSIKGVENYFQQSETEAINTSYFSICRAWFNSDYQEWNLLIPSGSGQTTINTWLVYDLIRDRWYKNTPTDDFPEGAFPVVDTNGLSYNYGYTTDNGGVLLRMENGLKWGDTDDIENKVTTSDFFFTKSLWDITRLRRLCSIFKTNTASDITVEYYKDTRTTPETVDALPSAATMALTGHRIRHLISYLDLRAWVHRLAFIVKNATSVKPVLLGFGAYFQRVYEELKDRDDYETITITASSNDVLIFTSSQGGSDVSITVPAGVYTFDAALHALEDAMNDNDELVGVFTVTCVDSKTTISIDSGTIAYTNNGSAGGSAFGFTSDKAAASSITADNALTEAP